MALLTTLNTTSAATSSTNYQNFFNKQYYDRKMLEYAKTQFVYANYGQKRPIPANNGKTVEFRRWELFKPDLALNDGTSTGTVGGKEYSKTGLKLVEGVTPASQNLEQTKVEATVDQYGAWVQTTDMLDLTAYDPVVNDASELLGEVMGTALDHVARNAMIAGASAQFANGRGNENGILAADKMTINEIRKAVKTLDKAKARKFSNGGRAHYICIVDPDVVYDLQSDSAWLDVHTYQDKEAIYNGELGRMYGVVFIESTEGLVKENTASPKVAIHHSLIFGADAYGIVDIAGKGNIQSIIKPLGTCGEDPLNQRSSIACKCMSYAAVVLNNNWIIDIMSAAS